MIGDQGSMVTKENDWKEVSPQRVGKGHINFLQKQSSEIVISASKYSVLSDEKEEGEFRLGIMESMEDVMLEENEEFEMSELEDSVINQRVKEWGKLGMQKGRKRGQKTKAQDSTPGKGSRSSHRKH